MRLLNRLRFCIRRSRMHRDLAEEMRIHREMLEEQAGREDGRRRFGNTTAALEQSREQWSFAWIESLIQDLRYALRGFRRSKAFAAIAVLTLGIGLGLNTVVFAVFNAYVLRPFAVRDPDSLYQIDWSSKNGKFPYFSYHEYQSLRERRDVFVDAAAVTPTSVLTGQRKLAGVLVSGNYFPMLGVDTLLGRPLTEEDTVRPGANAVAVISHKTWVSVFGQDPQILGRQITLNGHRFEVIGVTRPEFTGPEDWPPEFWAPVTMVRELKPGQDLFGLSQPRDLRLIVRLRADVTPVQVTDALLPLIRESALRLGEAPETVDVRVTPRSTVIPLTSNLLAEFSPIFAAFILVLIAACANVSNVMLARATSRQREIGVRLSLGASRWRLIRQLLSEGLLIALLAGATGIAIAKAAVEVGQKLIFAAIPGQFSVRLVPLTIDRRVFLFALAAATAATLSFGLAPALHATRTGLASALRGELAGFRASRLRNALVITQVTVCLVLFVCAATLFRNIGVFQNQDVRLHLNGVVRVSGDDRMRREMATELAARPDFQVAAVGRGPLAGRLRQIAVTPAGASDVTIAFYNFVSPEYFRLLEVPILRGRVFSQEEAVSEAPVVIVSEATARRFWPGEEALGKTFRIDTGRRRSVDQLTGLSKAQVIGIARDVVSGRIFDGTDSTCIYFPTTVRGTRAGSLLIRGRAEDSATAVREYLTSRWPEAAMEIMPLEQALAFQTFPLRASSWVGWILGVVALLLAISGMYGVMAYLVGQRKKELGIRIALGATPGQVLRVVMRHSVKLICAGLAIGLGVSLAVSRLMTAVIVIRKVVTWDFAAIAASVVVVSAAALVAAYFPSRRASCLDPVSTLRFD